MYDIDDGINYLCNIYYDSSDLDYFFKFSDEIFLRNNFELLEIDLKAYDDDQIMSLNYKCGDKIRKLGTLNCEYCIDNSFANIDEKTFICLFCHRNGCYSLRKISMNKNNYCC